MIKKKKKKEAWDLGLDPSAHCPFYDTTLKKMFGNPELYAKAFPHSWEAEQFRAGQYDLSTFTPSILHTDYAPKTTTPTYVQAAGSGPGKRNKKGKGTSAIEVARDGDKVINTPSSLSQASRRFFASRSSPAPHALAQRIASTFPDIAAATRSESNCLLPKGFIAKVNNRGAVSLTGTNPTTPAESYTPDFDALTRRLNQSFPVGDIPWLTFTQALPTIQLAVHSIPTDILPEDDEQLFTFIKNSIHKTKAVTIAAARYLNQDRAARLSKQATSVVVSVNPDDVPILTPALFLFSKLLKVEKTTQANRYTQCTNCYRFGHAHARCTQKQPTCPFCALHHTRSAHRCQNPTCPKGGDSKAISGYCPTPPPHCPNCGDDHHDFSRTCKARPVPPPQPEAPAPSEEELSDASSNSEDAMDVRDDGRPAPSTPEAPPAQTIDLSTPRPAQQSKDTDAPPSGSRPVPTGQGLPLATPDKSSGPSRK